jgi:hypothetical protein
VISDLLLVWALVVVGVLLALSVALFLGHGLWSLRHERRKAMQLAHGRVVVQTVAHQGEISDEDVQLLRSHPRNFQVWLLGEFLRNLAGASRDRVQALAEQIGLIAFAERRCRSRFWWRRLQGARILTLCEAGEAVMVELFRDPSPIVRTQAAEWAATHPSLRVVHHLLGLLQDPQGLCRFTVQDSLLRIGRAAAEPLRHYLETHTGADAESALAVAAGVAVPSFLAPALTLSTDPQPGVRARAADLLGALGGQQAADRLGALLADPDPRPRAAAARALGALGDWHSARRVAELLRDPAWIVRREAGLALRTLGNPGTVLLRRALRDPDRFAADMARQVMDIPG